MSRSGAVMTADTDRGAANGLRAPELVDRRVDALLREGDVFKPSMERIVVADLAPIDSHGRVYRRLDVFWFDIAGPGRRPSRPAIIHRIGAVRRGSSNGTPTVDTGAGKHSGLLQPVIPAASRSDWSHCSTELADHYYQRLIQESRSR